MAPLVVLLAVEARVAAHVVWQVLEHDVRVQAHVKRHFAVRTRDRPRAQPFFPPRPLHFKRQPVLQLLQEPGVGKCALDDVTRDVGIAVARKRRKAVQALEGLVFVVLKQYGLHALVNAGAAEMVPRSAGVGRSKGGDGFETTPVGEVNKNKSRRRRATYV
jgi:hypothetical protein